MLDTVTGCVWLNVLLRAGKALHIPLVARRQLLHPPVFPPLPLHHLIKSCYSILYIITAPLFYTCYTSPAHNLSNLCWSHMHCIPSCSWCIIAAICSFTLLQSMSVYVNLFSSSFYSRLAIWQWVLCNNHSNCRFVRIRDLRKRICNFNQFSY